MQEFVLIIKPLEIRIQNVNNRLDVIGILIKNKFANEKKKKII